MVSLSDTSAQTEERSKSEGEYNPSLSEFSTLTLLEQPGLAHSALADGPGGSSRLIKTNPDKTLVRGENGYIGDPERWDKYSELGTALAFKKYIEDRIDWSVWIFGRDTKTNEDLTIHKNKIHRWSQPYLNQRLAQLYKLRDWKTEHPEKPSNMWTFTVPHDYNKWGQKVRSGANHYEAWENLKQGWNRLRDCSVMRGRSFVVFYEPHPGTGYPHIHTMNFDSFTDEDQQHIKELWHGFTGADLMEGSQYDPGKNPKSLVAYLMKYLAKQMCNNIDAWTSSDWLFNAIAHKNKYRLFSASRNLSAVMDLDKKEPSGSFEWDMVKVTGLVKRFDSDNITSHRLWTNPDSKKEHPGKLLADIDVTIVDRKLYPAVAVTDDLANRDFENRIRYRETTIARRLAEGRWDNEGRFPVK